MVRQILKNSLKSVATEYGFIFRSPYAWKPLEDLALVIEVDTHPATGGSGLQLGVTTCSSIKLKPPHCGRWLLRISNDFVPDSPFREYSKELWAGSITDSEPQKVDDLVRWTVEWVLKTWPDDEAVREMILNSQPPFDQGRLLLVAKEWAQSRVDKPGQPS